MTKLTDADIASAAAMLGCPEARVRAVCAVESRGSGFDDNGSPFILFEATIFHRLTGGRYDATYKNLSSPTWNRLLYSTGATPTIRNAGEWERLSNARVLNTPAANMSASWGLFQITGQNFHACGFDTLPDFVAAMGKDEQAHLDAFVEFVLASSALTAAIRSGDAAAFAKAYNGPAYAVNKYDEKLTAAGF